MGKHTERITIQLPDGKETTETLELDDDATDAQAQSFAFTQWQNRQKRTKPTDRLKGPSSEGGVPRWVMPFQYKEGDQTPWYDKALGYGLDLANAATLGIIPEAGYAAAQAPKLAAKFAATRLFPGAVVGTGVGLGASALGASPEEASALGAITGMGTTASPAASGGALGAMTNPVVKTVRSPRNTGILGLILHGMGFDKTTAGLLSELPAAVEGAVKGARGKELLDPAIGRAMQSSTVDNGPTFGFPIMGVAGRAKMPNLPPTLETYPAIEATHVREAGPISRPLLPEGQPRPYYSAPEQIFRMPGATPPEETIAGELTMPRPYLPTALPPGTQTPPLELTPGVNYPQLGPASQIQLGPSAPIPESRRLPAPPYPGPVDFSSPIKINLTPEYSPTAVSNPATRKSLTQTGAKSAAKEPGPETPPHGHPGQVADPPPVPSTKESKARINNDTVVKETGKSSEPYKAEAGPEAPDQFRYKDAKILADKLGVTPTSIMRWVESQGVPVERSKMNKAGSWGSKSTTESIMDAIGYEGILRMLAG